MHKRNKHKVNYSFDTLTKAYPTLEPYIFTNKHKTETIDFANPKAVKALNTALLKAYYGVDYWGFPDSYLCPPIPGRVDYIHHLSDLLKKSNITKDIKALDIGTGASCIYPLLGNAAYDWTFVAVDTNEKALNLAKTIVDKNNLRIKIQFRQQKDSAQIFKGILTKTDKFAVTMCNPPFFKSEVEALEATTRKLKGLGKATDTVIRNFAGQAHELWFTGGEKAFLHTYLYESSLYKEQCFWYTSLVSSKDNIKSMKKSLDKLGATAVKVIEMNLGNKKSRVVAWTFLNETQQQDWNNN